MEDSHSPLVKLTDVHKSYPLGRILVPALRGLNLVIARGEFAALAGASGSGKSTLLNLIGAIDIPDTGRVELDGVELAGLSDAKRSRLRNERIGFIFQSFNLVPVLNVYENVELPLLIHPRLGRTGRRERVLRAIEEVGLTTKLSHRPDQLSGGERQRVAIARALVTEPSLVLADEPTANLDSVNAHKIIDLMQELNAKRKVTFLFCTHDEKLISRVDRRFRIRDGAIVKDGDSQ